MSIQLFSVLAGHVHPLHLSCIDPSAALSLSDQPVLLAMAGSRPAEFLLVAHVESTCQAAFA
jgi:hypothetical protein